MPLTEFSTWLYATSISTAIRETSWIVPLVQSIHICAITMVIGSTLVSDLRLAGLIATDESPSNVVRRYLPWMWASLVVLLLTGVTMVVGEPDRTLPNTIFWWKMGLVVGAFALTMFFRKPFLDPAFELHHARWARLAKPAAILSLVIWIAVIFCGRWIAYYEG